MESDETEVLKFKLNSCRYQERQQERTRFPRDGRFIEEIGTYNPCVSPAEIKIDTERAQAWIKSGAQPTDTVRALLKKVEVL